MQQQGKERKGVGSENKDKKERERQREGESEGEAIVMATNEASACEITIAPLLSRPANHDSPHQWATFE